MRKKIAISYNNAGLGDLMHQINFAFSFAKANNCDFIIEDYVCSLFGGIDYTNEMGWTLYSGYSETSTQFELVKSSEVFNHSFSADLTKIIFDYSFDHYNIIKKENFPYAELFRKKHGEIAQIENHCLIQLRMGEIRSYQTPLGKFHPHLGAFTKDDGRSSWTFAYLSNILKDLKEKHYTIEIITDGVGAALNSINWRSTPIENEFGLSNQQIASLVENSANGEINALNFICNNIHVNENFIDTIKRIMSATKLIYTNSVFVPMVYYHLMDVNKTKLIYFEKYYEESL
jgi:hypothetical protein